MRVAISFVGIVLTACAGPNASGHLIPEYFRREHSDVMARYLEGQAGFRVATDADCGCEEDLNRARTESSGSWEANPAYHPYYAVGDFNQDGASDFGAGVIDPKLPGSFRLVVFNGPFSKSTAAPAFVSEPRGLGQALFYGPPRPQPYFLVVGAFESEGALLHQTKSGNYTLTEGDEGA
jgi:hypothetical protein